MNKPNFGALLKTAKLKAAQHSPEILMGIGIAGMFTTTILAVKATPKALLLIQEAENEKREDLTAIETVKAAWKPYIPAVVTGALSTACLIGSGTVNTRRNAALATAYKISETALTEYREKVVETIGEKKEKTVRDAIAKDKLDKNPVSKNEVIVTDRGSTLCYDPLSARYFRTDIDRVKRAENNLNKQMLHDISGYVSLNEFYDELGLEHTAIGDELGWNAYRLVDIDFSSHLTENDEPALVINFIEPPKYGYSHF